MPLMVLCTACDIPAHSVDSQNSTRCMLPQDLHSSITSRADVTFEPDPRISVIHHMTISLFIDGGSPRNVDPFYWRLFPNSANFL